MITASAISAFQSIETPFYYYDMELLKKTLDIYTSQIKKYGYHAHFALKANAEPRILEMIKNAGLGADCVSGNEVALAIKSGFGAENVVYAGVGKSDKEIKTALKAGIFSFNCESVPEVKVINDLAAGMGKVAKIALRINPDIDAHTHKYISTGLKENKFGVSPWMFEDFANLFKECKNVELIGLHFHVGSQILDLGVFKTLCERIAELQKWFTDRGMFIPNLNLGGGLGIATLVSLMDVATANNTVAIVMAGPIAKNISEEYGISPRKSASLLDIFGSVIQGIIPYGAQMITAVALTGVSAINIIPLLFYPYLLAISAIVFMFLPPLKFGKKAK